MSKSCFSRTRHKINTIFAEIDTNPAEDDVIILYKDSLFIGID